ncbi:MAG: bifunctional hydroxymethylpyrimidine kinase/phosphomethylpyrimidine kinase [Alphaproteobacteria bacterium]|nr:bifunctional hydroxymethylpyrimidine kinase/phosphomethylpyrimidine kinase [Alphaproteobacteria bacterium]
MISPILCIGQSDSCAGGGIQADVKTAMALGGYAATIVTEVSVQNTKGVFASHPVPPIMVHTQIQKVMEDIKPTVIKTGALCNEDVINMIGDMLDEKDTDYDTIQLVVDPVMQRTGVDLLDKAGRDAFKRRLLIHADILTPNITEATKLSGIKIGDVDAMCHAAETLRTLGAKTVIIKGGDLPGEAIQDVLSDEKGTEIYNHERLETKAHYGAGATFSTAVAVGLSKGQDVRTAYQGAIAFMLKAMQAAESIGDGYDPLNHAVGL